MRATGSEFISSKGQSFAQPATANSNSHIETYERPSEPVKVWETNLQNHVAFFDRNGDGVITLMETYDGMRAIGFGIILSIFGTIIIHTFMSYPTQESWIPDPSLPIYIKNIHRCKHGSDSEVYNHRGNVNAERLDSLFGSSGDSLKSSFRIFSFEDVWNMTNSFRDLLDPFGWMAAKVEWIFLWILSGYALDRSAIISQYDGSYFGTMEKINHAAANKGKDVHQ